MTSHLTRDCVLHHRFQVALVTSGDSSLNWQWHEKHYKALT